MDFDAVDGPFAGAGDDPAARGAAPVDVQAAMLQGTLRDVAAETGMLADVAARIESPDADRAVRVERGEAERLREDLMFQTPDWERAAGRRDDLGVSDLFGG